MYGPAMHTAREGKTSLRSNVISFKRGKVLDMHWLAGFRERFIS